MRISIVSATLLVVAGCAGNNPDPAAPPPVLPTLPATTSTAPPGAVAAGTMQAEMNKKMEPPKAAAELTDRFGDSVETAVPVPKDAPNEGVDFENRWIYDRYGRFRRTKGGVGQQNGRRYDVITVELPDTSQHTVYFDITENWNAWTPPGKP